MKRNIASAIFGVFILFSTLPNAQTINKRTDSFDGDSHYFTEIKKADVEGGSFWSGTYVYFNLHAFKSTSKSSRPFLLRIKTHTEDWIFISKGASLHLKLDGAKMMELAGEGSIRNREVVALAKVDEIASYALTLDELRRISQAKTIDFRVFGERQYITGTLPPEFIADAALFAKSGPELLGVSEEAMSAASTPSNAFVSPPPVKLGVTTIPANDTIAAMMNMAYSSGVAIILVVPYSPAAVAGIRKGDVLVKYGDKPVATHDELIALVQKAERGSTVPLTIWRQNAESVINVIF